MQLHETGAARRPKLGLPFGGKPRQKQQNCTQHRTSPTLTALELRRLVAEMID